jgi:large subunit ribosomal protein LX
MDEKKYEVKGEYLESRAWKPYTKIVAAPNERQAEERIYNTIGSKHRLKRMYIKINSINQQSGE